MGFLRSSCRGFDEGIVSESKRIAVVLRVLLHRSKSSHALLAQADLLERLHLLDSAGEVVAAPMESTFTLTGVHMEVIGDHEAFKNSYIPKLGEGMPYSQPDFRVQVHELLNRRKAPRAPGMHLSFERWWTQTVINAMGRQFTRSDLVLTTANQDGGAHVDPTVDKDYYDLTRLNALGIFAGGDTKRIQLQWGIADPRLTDAHDTELTSPGSPVPASLRQIAWELTTTLERRYPELG